MLNMIMNNDMQCVCGGVSVMKSQGLFSYSSLPPALTEGTLCPYEQVLEVVACVVLAERLEQVLHACACTHMQAHADTWHVQVCTQGRMHPANAHTPLTVSFYDQHM